MAPLDALFVFHAQRAAAVDDAKNAAALGGFRDDDLDGIGRGAEDAGDFGDFLDAGEQVDGEAFAEKDKEGVARADQLRVGDSGLLHFIVVAFDPDEAVATGFAKGNAELRIGVRVDDGLVKVLDRFDEVALAEDEVGAFRNRQRHGMQLHSSFIC